MMECMSTSNPFIKVGSVFDWLRDCLDEQSSAGKGAHPFPQDARRHVETRPFVIRKTKGIFVPDVSRVWSGPFVRWLSTCRRARQRSAFDALVFSCGKGEPSFRSWPTLAKPTLAKPTLASLFCYRVWPNRLWPELVF